MDIYDFLKGKKVKVMTNAGVEVELTIASATEKRHSIDTEPATPENDWWPSSSNWTTVEVEFTNGYTKSYSNFSDIEIID